jgi:hypothetical protein
MPRPLAYRPRTPLPCGWRIAFSSDEIGVGPFKQLEDPGLARVRQPGERRGEGARDRAGIDPYGLQVEDQRGDRGEGHRGVVAQEQVQSALEPRHRRLGRAARGPRQAQPARPLGQGPQQRNGELVGERHEPVEHPHQEFREPGVDAAGLAPRRSLDAGVRVGARHHEDRQAAHRVEREQVQRLGDRFGTGGAGRVGEYRAPDV